MLERLVFKSPLQCTSQRVKRTSAARAMVSFGRSVARSLDCSIARSLARSLPRPLIRSLTRSLVRSLDLSLDRSLDRSVARSVARSGARSLARPLRQFYACAWWRPWPNAICTRVEACLHLERHTLLCLDPAPSYLPCESMSFPRPALICDRPSFIGCQAPAKRLFTSRSEMLPTP